MNEKTFLIALDLDGTLLTANDAISFHTKSVLQRAISDGHHVIICTGRPFRRSKIYYEELNLDTPIVNFHGAYVHHPKDINWEILHTPIDYHVANDIINFSNKYGVQNIVIEMMDQKIFMNIENIDLMKAFFNPKDVEFHTMPSSLQFSPTSLLIHPHDKGSCNIRKILSETYNGIIKCIQWGPPWNLLEFQSVGSNKAIGLKKICEYFDISSDRVIAFGDGENDIEMIEFAGMGVAMGNAVPKLKTLSKAVTLGNDENGIAVFLDKYLYS